MTRAKSGDTVKFHYACRLEDGTKYDRSRSGDPFKFKIGSGDAPWGPEAGMIDMAVGETEIVVVSPEKALAPHCADLLEAIDRAEIAGGAGLELGSMVQTVGLDDSSILATIVNLTSDGVARDTIHPLAGKQVDFEASRLRPEDRRTYCQRWAPANG